MRRRSYRATAVKDVKVSEVLERISTGPVCIGLDVSKGEVFAVVRGSSGYFERPWKVKQPTEVRLLVSLIASAA